MTKSPLVRYLYAKSTWIEDMFTFERKIRGEPLEFQIGESSECFTKEDVSEFNAELAKIPEPEGPGLRKELDNLRAMVKSALEDPNLTLLLSIL